MSRKGSAQYAAPCQAWANVARMLAIDSVSALYTALKEQQLLDGIITRAEAMKIHSNKTGETMNKEFDQNSFGLTKKQEAFAQAVIVENTLSGAYRKAYDCAGMTAKSVNDTASKQAKHPEITQRIAELRDRAEKAADVALDRWMREQARIAFADPLELYSDDGSLKLLSELSADARATIASIEIETRMVGEKEITIKKVKLHSKTAALESIGRALGAYEKDNKQRGDIIPVIANAPDWVTRVPALSN